MDLAWLEDFLALVDSGNFSRAAEARHMTQPAFSRRIQALEAWVGVALFERAGQPVALTEAGRRFRPAADELLRRLLQAREEARDADGLIAATLRFAATHALSTTFFPAWLRRLDAEATAGAIRLMSDSLARCERLMLAGEAQFLLCHHHDAAPSGLDRQGFRAVTVGTDVLLPVSAPDAAGRPRFPLGGLPLGAGGAAVPYLAYSDESGLGRIVRAVEAPGRPRLHDPVVTSHLAGVLTALARDGRGVAWLPRSLIADDLAAGLLVPAGDPDWTIPVEIRLTRPRALLSAAAERFWSLIAP
ncbi:LysR family transcriptional regulator [Aliidongia dinghuensis]|uniref:LysR family transcriptional regulator n=1 Tax=Aliidongia dinghuensis TaxID=1867774 RepID=A0A8J2YTB4_9PROT|nr:LysR family transcriptional regulator [Aliidongia dinghuensis]GGF16998.1 LysR family transcriptional regulator [Aliidongia dinghuensis]